MHNVHYYCCLKCYLVLDYVYFFSSRNAFASTENQISYMRTVDSKKCKFVQVNFLSEIRP